MKKARKPRGIKQDGTRSLDLCPHCYSFYCDPMTMSHKFSAKISRRHGEHVCPACGSRPCKCKSSLDVRPNVLLPADISGYKSDVVIFAPFILELGDKMHITYHGVPYSVVRQNGKLVVDKKEEKRKRL